MFPRLESGQNPVRSPISSPEALLRNIRKGFQFMVFGPTGKGRFWSLGCRAARKTLPKGEVRSAQTEPQIDDFRSVRKQCIKNPV
jgi:hypothetical protein